MAEVALIRTDFIDNMSTGFDHKFKNGVKVFPFMG